MDCKEFSNLLDAFMDGTLSDAEAERMRDHAAECEGCAARLTLRQDCRRLEEEIEVPEGFSSSWRQMIREEKTMEEKTRKKVNWKAWAATAAALVFVIGGTLISRDSMTPRTLYSAQNGAVESGALGSSMRSAKYTADTGAMTNFSYAAGAMEAPAEAMFGDYDLMDYEVAEESAMDSGGTVREEKIIRNASFTLKTTAYDTDLQRLQDLTSEMGGRVEYLSASGDASSGQTRSASLTLRIPAARLDDFLTGAQGIGNVTAMTQEMQDVSDSYYDIQTRLKTQQEKLARLQEMMKAAQDVSDLIEIESAIADAQYYIDRYTGQLKAYDGKVEYSTVNVSVREVRITEMKEVTLGERILDGLSDSLESFQYFLEDMVIFLVSALPWLIVLAVVIVVIRVIVKKKKKKKE